VPPTPTTFAVKVCDGFEQPVPEMVVCPTPAAPAVVQTASHPPAASTVPGALPVTGGLSMPLLLGGAGLVVAGGGLLVATRRRAMS
jgi:hypothetical protein